MPSKILVQCAKRDFAEHRELLAHDMIALSVENRFGLKGTAISMRGHRGDIAATRAWFAARDAGWTPAQRVKRALVNAGEGWAI
jgi:hypothetical protein